MDTTIIIFTLLGILSYISSLYLPAQYSRLAILSARTSFFLMNMGFWIGALWGDRFSNQASISEMPFIIIWAIVLIAVGLWAVMTNRRWALNISAVFAAIHFYTQWFERLSATPGSILFAGIIALCIAVGLRYMNQCLAERKCVF